jgi:hypothetical protein
MTTPESEMIETQTLRFFSTGEDAITKDEYTAWFDKLTPDEATEATRVFAVKAEAFKTAHDGMSKSEAFVADNPIVHIAKKLRLLSTDTHAIIDVSGESKPGEHVTIVDANDEPISGIRSVAAGLVDAILETGVYTMDRHGDIKDSDKVGE